MTLLHRKSKVNLRQARHPPSLLWGVIGWIGLNATALAADESLAQRTAAASTTAHSARFCTTIKPFYWEIGDSKTVLAGATEGGAQPGANTPLPLSTASQWIFAAYVLQSRAGKLSESEISALTMRSGYDNLQFDRCVQRTPGLRQPQTVNNCFHALHLVGGSNSDFKPAQVGRFFYNGGHFQRLAAVDPRLGELSSNGLTSLIGAQLGTGIALTYDWPQLDAGLRATPASYGGFLRRILANQLLMHDSLGSNAVCTNPSRCQSAINTPLPQTESSHYSLGHWVEDDPRSGDGAFSDPGLLGFYPWIDASKTYYGLVARASQAPGAHVGSMQCGRLIRRAWMSGKPQ
jgi:hypothetical protein